MSRVFIIAEAGVNHNGSLELALRLIDAAKASGADAVKFQSFRRIFSPPERHPKAVYQERAMGGAESQWEMLQRLELDAGAHDRLIRHCRQVGIQFLSSPFDMQSADLLAAMGLPLFKVPSGEITNFPFLQHIAHKGKPVILSTGMSTLGEVEEAVNVLAGRGSPRIIPFALCHRVSCAIRRGESPGHADAQVGLWVAGRVFGSHPRHRNCHCGRGDGR